MRPEPWKTGASATMREKAEIVDTMGDGLIVTDLNGNIIFVNRAMDDYLVENGVDTKEFIGKSALDLPTVRPEDTKKFAKLMKEVVEKGRAGPLEFQDVAGCWGSITVSLLKDTNGDPSALFAVRRDITERKWVEEKIRQQNELLEKVLESLIYPHYVRKAS